MPLAARLPCWGDLGRYEARNFSLPTLSEYGETIENQELESYTPAGSHLGQYAAGAAE